MFITNVLTTFCYLLGLLSITFYLSTRSAALLSRAAVTPMAALYDRQKLNVSIASLAFGLLHLVSTTAVFTTLSVASSAICKLSGPPATCLPTPKSLSCIGIWISTSQTPKIRVIRAAHKMHFNSGGLSAHALSVLID